MSAEAFDWDHGRFLVADGPLRYFAAERTTVLLGVVPTGPVHQICQVQLARSGAVFVQVPYFRGSGGLVARFSSRVAAGQTATLRFGELGKTTSHPVKYSHPPDGNAHFSQDGKVLSEVRKESLRLDSDSGHLFELHAFGLAGFTELAPGKERAGRLYLPFGVKEPVGGVAVVGEWLRRSRLVQLAEQRGEPLGPLADIPRRRDGELFRACLIGRPNVKGEQEYLLGLSVTPLAQLPSLSEPVLLFLGGWDRKASPNGATEFLAFTYPCENIEEFARRLGTIDYQPAPPTPDAGAG